MNKQTVIVAGFPGVGKTLCVDTLSDKYRMIDSDSSLFSWVYENGIKTDKRNPDFPNNYIKHIKENLGKVDVIFVSTHKSVRDALKANNLKYVLVYPELGDSEYSKCNYITRYVKRNSDAYFINYMFNHWEEFIGDLMMEEWPVHYVLTTQKNNIQNLSDVIDDIILLNS